MLLDVLGGRLAAEDLPDDVAIVGHDDTAAVAVPLTSVRKPRHQHDQPVFEPMLVVRESSTVRRLRPAAAS